MTNFHDYLTSLYNTVHTDKSSDEATHLAYAVLGAMGTAGSGRAMLWTALDAVDNVLDVAANQGTNEDVRELRDALEHSPDYAPQPSNETSQKLMGELWNHSFRPDYLEGSDAPLDDVHTAWCDMVGRAAMETVIAYVESHAPDEDEDDEDEDDA